MKKITVSYAIMNGGDGSAYLKWYLFGASAMQAEENQSEGWGECCVGKVETFEGSDIHQQAVANEKELLSEEIDPN